MLYAYEKTPYGYYLPSVSGSSTNLSKRRKKEDSTKDAVTSSI